MVTKTLVRGFRILCYLAFASVAGSFIVVSVLSLTNLCSRIDEGSVVCETAVLTSIAQGATAVILLSVFTLAPLALAICGLIFLIRKTIRSKLLAQVVPPGGAEKPAPAESREGPE